MKMELLNCTLPARGKETVASILEANNLPFHVPDIADEDWDDHYNCWGYVAFNFGWEETARWLQAETMEDHLAKHTVPITKAEATIGDIAVFRHTYGLTHTALVTHDMDIICHKPGHTPLCVDSMARANSMYGGTVSYVRPLNSKKFHLISQ